LGVVFDKNRVISLGFVLFFAILSSSLIYAHAREFNILASGEEEALTLGVEVERLKKIVFILGSLLVGLTVSFCGAIGFIGLVVPHITRLIVGPDHRILIPVSALIGAILIIVADIFARSVAPFEIPVGVITALFGVPFFAYLLRKRKAT
ncbi:MAG TPA: iron ABC transporter permease, partial [bacterium (Candidatus Stahlbacteria)]|nr:iron ABC transporter permease [Candidatus Stahlbacteria bacterium]